MNIIAKRFLESWFHDVWVLSSVKNIDRYYSPSAAGFFNGEKLTLENLKEHCAWCKENERITSYEFADVIAEGNKIAFRIQYHFTDHEGAKKSGENMVIFHLDAKGKIQSIWVKSSEHFSR